MSDAAPACRAALTQATVRWPGRRKASDGIVSSDAHRRQNPVSDHDHGNAFDLTHDPGHGVDCHALAVQLVDAAKVGREPRAKYVIWNRRIASAAHGWRWRDYDGSNPHDKHMHVSIYARHRGDTSPWWDGREPVYTTPAPVEEDELSPQDWTKLEALLDEKLRLLLRGEGADGKPTGHVNTIAGIRADLARLIKKVGA